MFFLQFDTIASRIYQIILLFIEHIAFAINIICVVSHCYFHLTVLCWMLPHSETFHETEQNRSIRTLYGWNFEVRLEIILHFSLHPPNNWCQELEVVLHFLLHLISHLFNLFLEIMIRIVKGEMISVIFVWLSWNLISRVLVLHLNYFVTVFPYFLLK